MTAATATAKYPTATTLVSEIKKFISLNGVIVSDWDDFVYEFISSYDEQFRDDPKWFSEIDSDMKDELRDEILELLGVE